MVDSLESRIATTARLLLDACRSNNSFITGDHRVSEHLAAELIGLTPASLKNLRQEGKAPASYRVSAGGSRISYRLTDIARWLEERREDW